MCNESKVPESTQFPSRDQQGFEPKDSALQCRAIVLNSSHRRASFEVALFLAFIVLVLNEMVLVLVLVLDAVSSSTSTANAEYEYENLGKTSIETPKHANSATSNRASGGVLRLSAAGLTAQGPSWCRSIGDNRSTITTRKQQSINPRL
jgi:hypothetical protein